jgi:Red chlorophyll catabolite reductase (RCC reductase)
VGGTTGEYRPGMAEETLEHVSAMVDRAPVDTTEWFERLWAMNEELFAKVRDRFELTLDPSAEPFSNYGGPAPTPAGRMTTFSGPEVDWLVFSRIGNPKVGFCNMHLTVHLGAHTNVPHLAMAFGTMPNLFFLTDYLPRADLSIDVESLVRYYQPLNLTWLERRSNPALHPFTSRALFVRQVLSPTDFCYTSERTEENFELLSSIAHAELDRWLSWVEAGDPVAIGDQSARAERDLAIRRNSAELDPANNMAARYFGDELTAKLVRQLWGGDRQLPRSGGFPNTNAHPPRSFPHE